MKIYIKTLWFENVEQKESKRRELNALGFYCLSIAENGLQVYAINDSLNWFDRLILKLTGGN